MSKTLEELARSNLSDLQISTDSVFSPEETASKVLGILRDTDRTEAVAAGDKKYGIITVRDLLGIDQPENTKIETIWRQVGTLSLNSSVLEAVDHLIKNNVTAIPVISQNDVALLSQQDISTALMDVPEMNSIKAKEIMKTPVIAADKETPIAHARSIMLEKGISHIPILNDQKLVGIVTGEEIVNTFITASTKVTRGNREGTKVTRFPGQVSGLMEKNPLKVTPDASVYDVVKLLDKMSEKYCLVVDEEDILHGIITHRELLRIIYSLMPEPELPVYIVGLDNEGFMERSVVEEKIRRTVARTMKMQEITEVSIKVKTARAIGPSTSFNVENEDWGLMEAFDGLISALDVSLKRAKKEPQKGARRGRRIPNPHLKP